MKTFSLSDLIAAERPKYASLVMKMDVEGAEYEVIPDLLENKTADHLDYVYVEFHSEYMQEPKRSIYRGREDRIQADFRSRNIPQRIWI
jgi:hypothetical protein